MSISLLPDDIIAYHIIPYLNDTVPFGSTCKKFRIIAINVLKTNINEMKEELENIDREYVNMKIRLSEKMRAIKK